MLHVHLDGPAHVIGVFLDECLELPYLEVGAVDLILGVGLEVHDDLGADLGLVEGGDGIAVRAGALPLGALFLAEFPRAHSDLVGHHEGGIEAHAELAYDGQILAAGLLAVHLALELVGAGLGDNAEVVLAFGHGHADAVVAHGEGARILVGDDLDGVVAALIGHAVVREGQIAELVNGVGRVGDDLTQEDLLVGVDGVDHQVEQTLALGLELLFTHNVWFASCILPRSPGRRRPPRDARIAVTLVL